MKRLSTYLLCLSVIVVTAGPLKADGVMRDGLGAISGGRGGTNLGHFDNGAILFDNPAGMVNLRSRGLTEISVDGLLTDLDYSDADNAGVSADRQPYALPHLSLIRKSDDGLWAFGLGFFAPAGFGAEYELTNTTVVPGTNSHRYMSFAALAKILPGVSCQLTDRLAVGGTLGLALSHAELEAPYYLQNGIGAVVDLQGTGAATVWSVGLQYELSDRTTLGATYTSESRFELDGSAVVNMAAPPLGQSRYDLQMDLEWPRSLGVGLRHEMSSYQVFSADVIWYDWSQAFDSLDLTLRNPTSPMYAGMPIVRDQLDLNWRDSVSVRLGYEHLVSRCSVLRAGYIYHRNPVPSGTLTPFIPATLEHALSTGYGHQWHDCRFDIGYQFSFGRSRDVVTSDLPGGDFNNSRMDASAHWLFLSLQQRF